MTQHHCVSLQLAMDGGKLGNIHVGWEQKKTSRLFNREVNWTTIVRYNLCCLVVFFLGYVKNSRQTLCWFSSFDIKAWCWISFAAHGDSGGSSHCSSPPRGRFSRRASCFLFKLQAWSPTVTCDPLAAQTASVMLLLESWRRLHWGHVVLLPKFNKRSKPCVGLCMHEGDNITIWWDKSYLVNTFALLKLDSKCFVYCFSGKWVINQADKRAELFFFTSDSFQRQCPCVFFVTLMSF